MQAAVAKTCRQCGKRFMMGLADHPRAGCCSRDCHQAFKLANGTRKQPPPKRNDPAEAGVVYALCEPDTKAVRYIGKTVNLKARIARYRCGKHHSPHLKNWIAKLGRQGKWPEVKLLETCLFGLGEAEKHWIKHGRERGWDLINATDGGDSGRPSAESMQRMKDAQRQRYADPKERRRSKLCSQKAVANARGITLEQYRTHRASVIREKRYRKQNAEAIKQRAALRRQAEHDQREAAERDARLRAFGVLTPLTCKGRAFVPLTRGAWAVVDAEDWDRVSQFKWSLHVKQYRNGNVVLRAKRSIVTGGKFKGCELLTRFIANAKAGDAVRCKNGNQLDCRKINTTQGL